jgi:type IV pilus assembly protein PilV
MPHHRPRRIHAQTGATLIEVLVSILIFSFGVLALVGLQSSMTRAQSEAQFRAEASFLANEVIARMWSEANNLTVYNGSVCSTHTPCQAWRDKVATQLPNGVGSILVNGANVTVTVQWRHSQGAGGNQRTYTTTTLISPA